MNALAQGEPALIPTDSLRAFLETDLNQLAGQGLKGYEDKLDALFCAYLALYFWRWGWDRNELFGTADVGYILNPQLVCGSADTG